jgi:hypothetical protein
MARTNFAEYALVDPDEATNKPVALQIDHVIMVTGDGTTGTDAPRIHR